MNLALSNSYLFTQQGDDFCFSLVVFVFSHCNACERQVKNVLFIYFFFILSICERSISIATTFARENEFLPFLSAWFMDFSFVAEFKKSGRASFLHEPWTSSSGLNRGQTEKSARTSIVPSPYSHLVPLGTNNLISIHC